MRRSAVRMQPVRRAAPVSAYGNATKPTPFGRVTDVLWKSRRAYERRVALGLRLLERKVNDDGTLTARRRRDRVGAAHASRQRVTVEARQVAGDHELDPTSDH